MGWRTIYIQSASKLSLNLDNLQIKYYNEKYNIGLKEIQTIVIEDYRCIITTRLLAKCCEEGINVIFCKNNKMPVGSLHSLNNNSRTSKYVREQLMFDPKSKALLWKKIVEQKIFNQINNLKYNNKDSKYLEGYVSNVLIGDKDNKEGQAARVYFKKLFGEDFIRDDDNLINFCLNYTYQIIRSKIAQEIVGRGLHPSFGIFHKGEYNYFNLADDIIEVYRPIVDFYIIKILDNYEFDYITPDLKEKLMGVYNFKVLISDKKMQVSDSIKIYMNNIVDVYNGKAFDNNKVPKIIDEQI